MTQSKKKLTVILADDHQEILQRATQLLMAYVDVVGTVLDGGAAVEAVERLNPDVVVLDIGMPVLDGLQVSRELKKRGYAGKIIFLTVENDPVWVVAALNAGANAYVIKRFMRTDLLRALEEVSSGSQYVSTVGKR